MGVRETYCLRDNEGDWWTSENGVGFISDALGNGPGYTRSIDHIASTFGIADDGISGTAPEPDAATDGYTWPALAQGSTIAHDAHEAVYGRADAYGHPRENLTRTAHLWTALLQPLLADGEYVTPEDVARCMVAVKLSRDVSHPKRDNRVDMAGYAIALDRMATGQ